MNSTINNLYYNWRGIILLYVLIFGLPNSLAKANNDDSTILRFYTSEDETIPPSTQVANIPDSIFIKKILKRYPKVAQSIDQKLTQSPEKSRHIVSMNQIGIHYFEQSRFDDAKTIFKGLLEQSEEERDWQEVANVYNLLGIMAEYDNQFVEMYFLNKKLMELGEKYNPELKATSHLNFGVFYSDVQDWGAAEERFKKGLLVYEKLPKTNVEYGWLLHRLGEVYKLTDKPQKAEVYLSKAMIFWEKSKNNRGKRFTNLQLAEVYSNLGEIERSRSIFQEVWQNCEQNNYYMCQVITSISLASLEYKEGNFPKAIEYLETGIALSMEKTNRYNIKDCYELLAKSYQAIGQFRKSNENYESYLAEIEQDEQANKLNAKKMIKNQNDLNNKEAAYQLLKQSEEIYQKKLSFQKIISLSGLLFTLLVSWIAYSYFKTNKRTNAQKEALHQLNTKIQEQSNKLSIANEKIFKQKRAVDMELVKKMMLLSQQVDAINNLKMLLANIPPSKTTSQMEKIIGESENNSIWEELNIQVTQSNSEFFKKLTNQFDKLSQSDLRLCALLKMNLRTKEIANLTFKNPQSVKVARSRLRKKLGLTHSNVDISTFLNQI